ncbi:hypothetical protein AB840_05980 [Megasphaera cerevisiae DSM 20462]|uniref:Uncharacterized protein n=1 Tax=Megasphaera cerevisiae DSM 20462 TaxID=1122219 RepID=A0A0J6WTJ7_9FIRM|nr:hypothetical protein AB840_05980 [Megasphaera cerevisiae DSM 20462]SJZ83807.1 hypothetical protein SAMN05660900_01584 [Megasphaera cerevisiae DSM 20462]
MRPGQTSLHTRTCKRCGIEFQGGPRVLHCPQCRHDNKKIYDKRAKLNRKLGKNIIVGVTIRKCDVCGKPFVMMSHRQRYCPECAPEEYKKVDREQSRGWLTRGAEKYGPSYIEQRNAQRRINRQEKNCIICGKLFVPAMRKSSTCSPVCRRVYRSYCALVRNYKIKDKEIPGIAKYLLSIRRQKSNTITQSPP